MEQSPLSVVINSYLGCPPFASIPFQLGPCVMDHALVVIDSIECEPCFSFNQEDLHIPQIELWERGGKWFRLTRGRLPHVLDIIFGVPRYSFVELTVPQPSRGRILLVV